MFLDATVLDRAEGLIVAEADVHNLAKQVEHTTEGRKSLNVPHHTI